MANEGKITEVDIKPTIQEVGMKVKQIQILICISCHVSENEEHFVTDCVNSREMKKSLFEKISVREPGFANWNNREKSVFLMSCEDPQILSWFIHFILTTWGRHFGFSLCYWILCNHISYLFCGDPILPVYTDLILACILVCTLFYFTYIILLSDICFTILCVMIFCMYLFYIVHCQQWRK